MEGALYITGSEREGSLVPELTVRLLGPPQLQVDQQDVRLASLKAHALLYYLVAQPGHAVSRSQVCALLWEDSSEAEGRNSLSTVLSRLRQALPRFPIVAEGDTLIWRPSDAVWVDTDAFTVAGASLDALRATVDLWRGPFLDGFFVRDSVAYDEWLRQMREVWEQRFLTLLWRLVEGAQAAGQWTLMQQAAQQALRVDPLQERFHRALMTSLYQAGDRAAALAQYENVVKLLDRELGAHPDPATVRVFEDIRDGKLARQQPRAQPPPVRRPILPPRSVAAPAIAIQERQAELGRLWAHLRAAEVRRQKSDDRPQTADHRPQTTDDRPQTTEDGPRTGSVLNPQSSVLGPQSSVFNLQSSIIPPAGQLVVIEGEAGIGKSRLLAEVIWRLSQVETTTWTVLQGYCYEAERSLPYHPFVDALTPLANNLDIASLDIPDVWLAEVARLVPDLAASRPEISASLRQDAPPDQRRLFEGIARFLTALPAPLLFILDDVHWADPGTLQLLAYLVRHLAHHPMLFVAAIRSEDADETLTNMVWRLEREDRLDRIGLKRLSSAGTAALMQDMVNSDVTLLSGRLYQETEGNPLFTVEIVRSLLEAGALGRPGAVPRGPLVLPPSVVAVIQGRLGRLSPSGRELLSAISVFRRDCDFETARQVSGQDEDEALDALDELLRSQLILEVDGAGEGVRYVFSHDKVREVVYTGLSHARRTTLHKRAFAALGAPRDPRAVERVAYHARLGRLWIEAFTWSVQAAQSATQVFAYSTAALLYQQALECLEHLPLDDNRRREGIMLRLHLARVAFYLNPGRLTEWLAPAETDALALGDEQLLAFVWLAQGAALYIQGQFKEAEPRLERLLPLVERAGDPLQVARTMNILGRLLSLKGDYARGLPLLSEAADRLDALGSHNDALISRGMVGAELAFQGKFTEALPRTLAIYEDSLKQADVAAIGAAAVFVQAVYHMSGQWEEAETWGRRALSYAQQSENVVYARNVYIHLGPCMAQRGDLDGGHAALQRAIAIGAEYQSGVFMGRAHAWLAEIELKRGEAQLARQTAEKGRALAETAGAQFDLALCRRVLGEALTVSGLWTEALAELTEAVGALRGMGAEPELGRGLAALGRLAQARGYTDQTRFWWDQAAEIFTRLNMTWDLAQLPPP